jgi:Predicted GTPase
MPAKVQIVEKRGRVEKVRTALEAINLIGDSYKVPDMALVENLDHFGPLSPPALAIDSLVTLCRLLSPIGSRSIEAILLGPANAGKSSLINALAGYAC